MRSMRAAPVTARLGKKAAFVFHNRRIYLEIKRAFWSDTLKKYREYYIDAPDTLRRTPRTRGVAFSGKVYRIGYSRLSCLGKYAAIRALFPSDAFTRGSWRHRIRYTGKDGETLWQIAFWFTGSGARYTQLMKHNAVTPEKLRKSLEIAIPSKLLLPCFRPEEPAPERVGELVYKSDGKGEYAEVKLKKGQTIYSDIVLKYTPRVTAEEVLEAARIILRRSGLKDFHTIAAGTPLKIPKQLISPQFLPPSDPKRIQFEKTVQDSRKYGKTRHAASLRNVIVVLDAGHGGVDPGAVGKNGVFEDEIAYDVMCRVKKLLEKRTKATVYCTILDDETGCKPRDAARLAGLNNREKILTHPPYYISKPRVALNLRWMLANYVFRKFTSKRRGEDKFIFTSFHADSLHPKAQGMMVYIPGADYYSGNWKKKARVYSRRKESKDNLRIRQSRKQRLKAEGFSAALAAALTDSCRARGVMLHSGQPVRKYIYRNRKAWVPSVLRYCKIPARALIELGNLNNNTDRRRLCTARYRQKLAETYFEGLQRYFHDAR